MVAAVVQSEYNWATSASFNSQPTAGNTVVVLAWSYQQNFAAGEVTDNQGNTYALVVGNAVRDEKTAIYMAYNIASSGTFTITCNPGATGGFIIHEVSGLTTTDPTDKSNSNSGEASSATPGTTGTLTQADEIAFVVGACAWQNGTDAVGNPTGWTQTGSETDNNSRQSGSGSYLVVSATTALNPSMALDTSLGFSACIATFMADAGGGAPTTRRYSLSLTGVG